MVGKQSLLNKWGTVGAYIDRCVQLHDDTGNNAGEEPDLIFVYLGTNDCTASPSVALGNYRGINFGSLIIQNENGYTYSEPKTASEAYAIMIHKMTVRYPDAEIYCMIPCQRTDLNTTQVSSALQFYDAIDKIAKRFGAYTVDLYNDSGITTDSDAFSTYIGDNFLHPSPEGMDAITSTVLSAIYQSSRYSPKEKSKYSVSYDTDAVVLEGHRYAVIEGESFACSFKERNSYVLNVTVAMGGVDITDEVYKDNKISIPSVSGSIVITAEYEYSPRDPLSFRFETVDDKLVSISDDSFAENAVTQDKGSISDGYYTSAHFSLEKRIELLHNRAWSVEWRFKGNPEMLLIAGKSQSMANRNGDAYLFVYNNGFIALGEYTGSQFDNYAATYDKSYHNEFHTYRLENRIGSDGSNDVYLLIDGVEIGSLNNYYVALSNKNKAVDWVNGRDFFFSNIGTSDQHPISNCYIGYIEITENMEI